MTKQEDPLAATTADTAHAARWLEKRGLPTPPSALVTARLKLRALGRQRDAALLAGCAFLIIGWALIAEFSGFAATVDDPQLRQAVELGFFYLLLTGVTWWSARRHYRGERRIGAALPRRATHSRRRGIVQVTGIWHFAAMLVIYAGGVGTGVAVAVSGWRIGAVLAVGALLMGVVTGVSVADAARRATLAEDDTSLIVDDLLRTEDTHRIAPYPLFMALIATFSGTLSAATAWIVIGYVIVGAVLWTVAVTVDHLGTNSRDALGATG